MLRAAPLARVARPLNQAHGRTRYNDAAGTCRSRRCSRVTAELSLETLVVGVDNIHHDVFLSQSSSKRRARFLFDLIRQLVNFRIFPDSSGNRCARRKLAALRKMLGRVDAVLAHPREIRKKH